MDVKTLGTELGYNGFLKIRVDHIELPNGLTFKFDYVDKIVAVLVLPILGDQIVMVKQYRHAVKREVYDLPGGGVHESESFEDAARRECQWQRDQLPDPIRALVLDAQARRNPICWSVFTEPGPLAAGPTHPSGGLQR